ncbi:MAG: hypothetical protein E7812_05785 [Phenylobacterium sp.]|nr:MAG: hypothetical protein E7812_05785 [Phenylobacterium sp.]
MSRVLLVGLVPETVDFTDPALPPGMTPEKIHVGVALAMQQMAERGWQAENLMFHPETAAEELRAKLAGQAYDCIVVGGGVRLPPRNLPLLETVLNTLAVAAPGVPIAFNTTPHDSADAAARWLGRR